jgi:hypothetical protein
VELSWRTSQLSASGILGLASFQLSMHGGVSWRMSQLSVSGILGMASLQLSMQGGVSWRMSQLNVSGILGLDTLQLSMQGGVELAHVSAERVRFTLAGHTSAEHARWSELAPKLC